MQRTPASSALPDEVARFDRLAARWWDPAGPMRPLHAMNPLRTGWIHRRLLPATAILDLGCGAGLAAEALARLGHPVLGLDAAPAPIAAARAHAEGQALPLHYMVGTAEHLVAAGRTFPAITALEVIEHVTDPRTFLRLAHTLLQPGGHLFVSTLNRTARSLVVAKLGAEYLLRLLPVGTHDWRRFVTPAELAAHAAAAGLRLEATAGMAYHPGTGTWSESRDLAINYIAQLTRPLTPNAPARNTARSNAAAPTPAAAAPAPAAAPPPPAPAPASPNPAQPSPARPNPAHPDTTTPPPGSASAPEPRTPAAPPPQHPPASA